MSATVTPPKGGWKVTRKGNNQVVVTLPDDVHLTGEDLTIEDLLATATAKAAADTGRAVVRCCSGDMAIA